METIKPQFDWQKRIVSLDNLEAMCGFVSGVCHNYKVVAVSANRSTVEYSNPTEYGTPQPMRASFPCYKCDGENVAVILDILRVTGDNWDGEGWQAFQLLLDCPVLWRNPSTDKWQTQDQIEAAKA